jgi:hypothetical protein
MVGYGIFIFNSYLYGEMKPDAAYNICLKCVSARKYFFFPAESFLPLINVEISDT